MNTFKNASLRYKVMPTFKWEPTPYQRNISRNSFASQTVLTYDEVMPDSPEEAAFSEAVVAGFFTVINGATGPFFDETGTLDDGALRFDCFAAWWKWFATFFLVRFHDGESVRAVPMKDG